MFRLYHAALTKRPLLTQSVTAGVLFGAGDVAAQMLIPPHEHPGAPPVPSAGAARSDTVDVPSSLFDSLPPSHPAHPSASGSSAGAEFLGHVGVANRPAGEFDVKSQWDPLRTGRLMFFGSCIAGPCATLWYRVLERVVTFKSPLNAAIGRVALDQVLFAPTFIGVFYATTGLLEGLSLAQIRIKLDQSYMATLVNNYKVWPAIQLGNFYFTPLNYRTVVTNSAALFWNTYLSFENSKHVDCG